MQCKWCEQEMVKGYIQCIDGVYWEEKKRLVARLPVSATAIRLGEESQNPFCGQLYNRLSLPKV